jgi:methylthioribulose-1-phosphate dehydratase
VTAKPASSIKRGKSHPRPAYSELAAQLADFARQFHSRGWALGTSGNLSAVLSESPLRLAITPSGFDKGLLRPAEILAIDGDGSVVSKGNGRVARGRTRAKVPLPVRPSDEAKLHLAIVRARQAKAVLHTHSVWATILSEKCAGRGGLSIEGYEMLKGLEGVRTHRHRAWLPILENSQDMTALARAVEAALAEHPSAHGFLLRGHGLYTWGQDLATAKRHVEILEFLMEVLGRRGEAL